MAQEEVVISVGVDASKGIGTLKDLKKELKEAKNAALNGDGEAAKRVAQLEDRLEDLKDTTKAVKGDGLEPLRNSFNLFKDGITNFDFGKIGTAFKGLGAAMKAVPIFLIVEGIMALINNFEELSKGSGLLGKALRFVGDIIDTLKNGIYAFTDAIGLTNSELDKMGEAIKTNADQARESLSLQNAEYDRQIKVAKAAGESTVELEKAKQEAIVETNVAVVKQIEAFVRAGGVLDDEKKKLLTASLNAIKDAKIEEIVIQEKKDKEAHDNWLKIQEEKKKKQEEDDKLTRERVEAQYEFFNDLLGKSLQAEIDLAKKKIDYKVQTDKILQDLEAKKAADAKAVKETELANENAFIVASLKEKHELTFNETITALEAERDLKLQNTKLTEQERVAIIEEYDSKEKTLKKQRFDENLKLTAQSLGAAQKLTDMYFAQQLKGAKGNADKEREIKKKQFNINKAFGITTAVIDGVRSVEAALTQTPPLSYVLAALNAGLAIANVAQIASAKFDDSGASAGGSGGGDIGNMGTVGASAPSIAQPNNTVTKIDDNGEIKKAKSEQPVVKAVVVETDVTDSQKRVNSIKESATF